MIYYLLWIESVYLMKLFVSQKQKFKQTTVKYVNRYAGQ